MSIAVVVLLSALAAGLTAGWLGTRHEERVLTSAEIRDWEDHFCEASEHAFSHHLLIPSQVLYLGDGQSEVWPCSV